MSSLSPDLNSGLTFASFGILGGDPEITLLFMIYTRLWAIMFADILRIFGPLLSKPVDLLTFKFDKKFLKHPTLVKVILNSTLLGTLDCTKVLRCSNSEFTIGSFSLEATFTQ